MYFFSRCIASFLELRWTLQGRRQILIGIDQGYEGDKREEWGDRGARSLRETGLQLVVRLRVCILLCFIVHYYLSIISTYDNSYHT